MDRHCKASAQKRALGSTCTEDVLKDLQQNHDLILPAPEFEIETSCGSEGSKGRRPC